MDRKRRIRAIIEEKRIQRCSKIQKDKILDDSLKKIGIDKKKLQEDLEAVKKQGGFELTLKK